VFEMRRGKQLGVESCDGVCARELGGERREVEVRVERERCEELG